MNFTIVDRRKNGKNKSSSNRQRFIRRVKSRVREAVKKSITSGNIRDIISPGDQNVNIPTKDINEPHFTHSSDSGELERILPGNKKYVPGDRIPKPPPQDGKGGNGSSGGGEQNDDFEFAITHDEYMDVFFEDLELPDLVKKGLAQTEEIKVKRAGFAVDGNPSKLNYVRSLRQSVGRRAALRTPKKRKLRELETELSELYEFIENNKDENGNLITECEEQQLRIIQIEHEIAVLKKKIKAVPFIDSIDLRYNRFEIVRTPITQAVMFCVMDVSGSMGEYEKDLAKRFFMLLYLFLHRNYKYVDVVFVKHHTAAFEVDEENFFYSRESGGTMVSSATTLVKNIIEERYDPSKWNIYVCQASDGDNDVDDCQQVVETLIKDILPVSQYYAYVQVNNPDNIMSQVYQHYLLGEHENFAMAIIEEPSDIYPVFHNLFEKDTSK
jgi:hypothetical protein